MAPRIGTYIYNFIACALVFAIEPPADAVTVSDLPGLIRSHNRDVKVANTEVEAADSEISVARARYYPQLELKSAYTRLNDDIVLDIPNHHVQRDILGGTVSIGIDVDPPPITLQKKNIMSSNLVLTQPIYAGGRISAGMDAAEAGLQIARTEMEQTYRERLANALIRYFQVQLATEVTTTLTKIESELNSIAGSAEAAVKSGAVPRFAIMQIKVSQIELSAKIQEARANLKLATLAFKDVASMDAMTVTEFASPLVLVGMNHGLDIFKTKALTERSEFKILEQKSIQVEALKDAKTGEMLPTMFLFGAYNVARENLPLLTPKWVAGVGLNVPITAGLSQIPERNKAAQLAQKVDILKAKAQAQIPLQIEQLYDHCEALAGALSTIESSQILAAEVQRLAEVRFKNSSGSAVEVLKASADNQSVQVKRLILLEEYNRHLIELYDASGSIENYIVAYETASKRNKKS